MYAHLSPTEHVWLTWYGRLRVSRYVGTAGSLYALLTGRPHPKVGDRQGGPDHERRLHQRR